MVEQKKRIEDNWEISVEWMRKLSPTSAYISRQSTDAPQVFISYHLITFRSMNSHLSREIKPPQGISNRTTPDIKCLFLIGTRYQFFFFFLFYRYTRYHLSKQVETIFNSRFIVGSKSCVLRYFI